MEQQKKKAEKLATSKVAALDGQWGWAVVAGSGILLACLSGTERSFGVIYVALRDKFDESAALTAWVGGVMSACRAVLGVLGAIVANRYSARVAVAIGCIFRATGFFASAFVDSIYPLYFSLSFMCGIGAALMQTPAVGLTGQYFEKKRSTAFGVAYSLAGIGGFAIPLFTQLSFDYYGYSSTLMILSGITLHMMIAAACFRPLEDNFPLSYRQKHKLDNAKKSSHRWLETDVLSNPAFVLMCFANLFSFMGTVSTFFLLPALAKSRGISSFYSSLLLSIVGIVDTLWRMPLGLLYDKFRPVRGQLFCVMLYLCSISAFMLAIAQHYYQFVIVVIVFGMSSSSMISQRTTIIADLVGATNLISALGIAVSCQGIGNIVGPPIAGLLRDYFDYGVSFLFAGASIFTGAIMMTLSIAYNIRQTSKMSTISTVDHTAC